jgi:hypothetical protein
MTSTTKRKPQQLEQQQPFFREVFKLLDSDIFDENQQIRPPVNLAV